MMKQMRKNPKIFKALCCFMAFSMLNSVIMPSRLFALTGGPSQPEVQSFEPVGTSDMVDLFSGDFNYNIPLMDVDGYPINISYHSGVTMDQEASWVGLGWNINPGVINRNMRGIPDDFNGEEIIEKEFNMKPNITYGVIAGIGLELFGNNDAVKKILKMNIDYTLTFKYNNYKGFGIDKSLNVALSLGLGGGSSLTGNLGISSSEDEGLTIAPSVGFSQQISKSSDGGASMGLRLGLSVNSRSGLKALSISGNFSALEETKKTKKTVSTLGASMGSSSFNFGSTTYTPKIDMSMKSTSLYGVFNLGLEVFGLLSSVKIGGFYSTQELANTYVAHKAYGYMFSENACQDPNALLDFNREKDGVYTQNPTNLPLTNFTYDIFSVNGQGVSGSYRPVRNDVGFVYDPRSTTTSDNYSLGVELGVTSTVELGVDFSLTDVSAESGQWKDGNYAVDYLTFKGTKADDPMYQPFYFKEANEMTVDNNPEMFDYLGGYDPINFKIKDPNSKTASLKNETSTGQSFAGSNQKSKRSHTNQAISYVNYGDYSKFALQPNLKSFIPTSAKSHQIAEVSVLRADGARYVYGIPAYNTLQKQVTFALGKDKDGIVQRNGFNLGNGLVKYASGADNTCSGNKHGLDNFVSKETLPAYAHSYMLTAVLSADYVDNDDIPGPSDGDIGSYTKFCYDTIKDYQWRVPYEKDKANYEEGLKSKDTDDKGSYIYGKKDILYLNSIVTKNYIAIFHLSDRDDALGVQGESGGQGIGMRKSKKLDKISLYTKKEYYGSSSPIPVKEVHFEYDYTLCPGVPNNNHQSNNGTGKLTLKSIYFTYQNSNKGRFSPYKFQYRNVTDAKYNLKGYDRWGNFKKNASFDTAYVNDANSLDPITTAEYPYVEQTQSTADDYSSAWTLNQITLPSGGIINVTYESDDYAYVQDRPATQMFKVVGINELNSLTTPSSGYDSFFMYPEPPPVNVFPIPPPEKKRLWIELNDADKNASFTSQKFYEKYLKGLNYVYFRFLMKITDNYEYVSGYTNISQINSNNFGVYPTNNPQYAYIALDNVHTGDGNKGSLVSPIVKSAIQFGRLYMADVVWKEDNFKEPLGGLIGMLKAILGVSIIKDLLNSTSNVNEQLLHKFIGDHAITNKSWLRLNNPIKKMLGGGCRVKKIEMLDNWNKMTKFNLEPSATYSQEYSYKLEDGSSSGVACYEPMIGGDENPMRKPVWETVDHVGAPDDELYKEEPFGESFFPAPSVGYSKVTVKNTVPSKATMHATGYVVHEFYTAKDFPTITLKTEVESSRAKNEGNFIASLLKLKIYDYMTLSQGYAVELNDMHGKVKSQKVYQEGGATPISSVEYRYKMTPSNNASRLNNTATVINKDGTVNQNATLGMVYDFVADMRNSKTTTSSVGINFNLNAFLLSILPIAVLSLFPNYTKEEKQFRSASTTKVIQRFGILDETIATQDGSVVSTKNLAFNSETGETMLTQTTTDFNDTVYSFKIPAYWYYDGMGQAYKNLDVLRDVKFVTDSFKAYSKDAENYFVSGDEVGLLNAGDILPVKYWVTDTKPDTLFLMAKNGSPPSFTGIKSVRILRSGRRNQQNTAMASITCHSNPLSTFSSNVYQNVVQANAIEFANSWRTYCDCFSAKNAGGNYTSNPYVAGIKGFWKPTRTYLYLSPRTQSNEMNNTNIRTDGMMTSFNPYYKLSGNKWDVDMHNWTYTTEVTEFSPYGQELENKDALGRYSAAVYGYNQSLAIAVGANTKYKELAYDNFEDYGFSYCADNHFKFNLPKLDETNGNAVIASIDSLNSHTGKKSIKVASGKSVS